MEFHAAIVNQHYARVQPKAGQAGTVVVSLISKDHNVQVKRKERIVIAETGESGNVHFLQEGIISQEPEVRPLALQDLEAWPNQRFAQRWEHDLMKQRELVDGKVIYLHQFIATEVTNLEGPNHSLDRLSFSLVSIDNYNKPISHFQQQIRNIDFEDYETIKAGWVFLARTAFAKIANALPKRNRFEFWLRMDKEYKIQQDKPLDYVKLFELLYDYIDARIFSRGRLLIASDDMLRANWPELSENALTEIGFSDEAGNRDSIRVQADRFRTLFEEGKPELLKQLNDEVMRNVASETRFINLFKNKPLPLILEQA